MNQGRLAVLPILSLRIDGDTQPRVKLDKSVIDDYAVGYERGDKFPNVVAFFDGEVYWLGGGFHRLAAARQAGWENITARVINGSREDAAWFALGDNRTHGQRMSNADKVRAVDRALTMHPEMGDRAIADYVGVTHPLVAKRREKSIETGSGGNGYHLNRTGLDGKKYPASAQPPPPPAVSVETPPPPPPERPATQAASPASPESLPPPPPAPAPSGPVDKVGCPVTGSLARMVFERAGEINDDLRTLSAMRTKIIAAIERGDSLYTWLTMTATQADFDNLSNRLKFALPYAVCPYCSGGGDNCSACRRLGWVPRSLWDSAPREMRAAMRKAAER